jgi:hypothetical protein
MTDQPVSTEKIRAVRHAREKELMSKANVVGVGLGLRQRAGQHTAEPALVVMVSRKVPIEALSPWDVIPASLDGVPVDVQEVGELKAF